MGYMALMARWHLSSVAIVIGTWPINVMPHYLLHKQGEGEGRGGGGEGGGEEEGERRGTGEKRNRSF